MELFNKTWNRLINEIILRLYNKEENIENLYKILLLVMNIIDKEEKIVFYSSDLNAFIDISILKLETNDSDDLKCFILEILKRIIKSKEYIYSMYRLNYLLNFMQYYILPNVHQFYGYNIHYNLFFCYVSMLY